MSGPSEVTISASGDDEPSVCLDCRDPYWTDLETLRRRAAKGNTCCGVILDALETWKESAQVTTHQLGVMRFYYDIVGAVNEIKVFVVHDDGQDTTLKVLRNMNADTAAVIPPWTERLKSVRLSLGNTSSTDSLNTLESWLNACDHHHTCHDLNAQFMPGRVIQISKNTIFLREDMVDKSKYACLSHCWGAEGLTHKLTKSSKPQFLRGFKVQDLPRTFRDAVQVCTRLGIEYLWIDALCIVQDDMGDWSENAAAMADIYRNAYLTIAATASYNSHEGCFRFATNRNALPLQRMPGLLVRKCEEDLPLDWMDSLKGYPLLQRAWVYQERRMSTRIVHFTGTQLVWECRSLVEAEDGWGVNIRKDHEGISLIDSEDIRTDDSAWQKTVQEYSRLDLTLERDRLPAIAAIVKDELDARENDVYLAGMWRSTLLADLMWSRNEQDYYVGKIAGEGQRPTTVAPTWSWASIDGPVYFHELALLSSVRILDVSYIPDGQPQMGKYSNAAITVEGPMIRATFDFESGLHRAYSSTRTMKDLVPCDSAGSILSLPPGIGARGGSTDFDFLADDPLNEHLNPLFFMFLGLGYSAGQGLVLRQRSDSDFERIGTCAYYCNDPQLNWHEQEESMRAYIDTLPVGQATIV